VSATAAQIARLRRMVAESTTTTYTDDDIAEAIERYPLIDERGLAPYAWDTSTTPPHQDATDGWIPTYDLNAAAADIWEEKAATIAGFYDFSADGQSFSRSQAVTQAMQQAARYRSRRSPKTITARPEPRRAVDVEWIGNLAEVDD
jgi:hypothetical protein